MYFTKMLRPCLALLLCIGCAQQLAAQAVKKPAKYPSLLWEITGNGMKKPSYLFGTMHVSSKKVFHLSDSFFTALRNADVVALELNPEVWQKEMVKLEKEQSEYRRFYTGRGFSGGSVREMTFRLDNDFIPTLKYALQESPMIINSLLYRTRGYAEDFEENTFLDMYIYQTGKKMGKRASGVENFYEMERLTMEAEIDQSKEKNKKKKKYDYDYEDNPRTKSDEAYRKGDLDLLDSLNKMMFESDAFMEKFLYRRNEIQAYSMDTIMKKGNSLFVGVGAAHLAGDRGVIEELRKKGYRLRPIKMIDRDAQQRDKVDNIRVPVGFSDFTSPDGFYKVRVPGELYQRSDAETGFGWQYADMSNGSYYTVTRIPTLSGFLGYTDAALLKKIDSLLYENIPGKIVKKTAITKNGFAGLDILNKTRRGDFQRYHIFVTPFEVLLFKMSGNETYVQNGKEATEFFNSITLNPYKNGQWTAYQPAVNGFSLQVPHRPYMRDEQGGDWTWAAADADGMQYIALKRTVFNNQELNADTLNLGLMEESFTGREKKLTRLERTFSQADNASQLTTLHSRNDSFMSTRYIIQGTHHFLLAARGKNKAAVQNNKFTSSFKLMPFAYGNSRLFTDTFVRFSVQTPLVPKVRDSLKALMQDYAGARGGEYSYGGGNDESYEMLALDKNMTFTNDTTGEVISVSMTKMGKYYTIYQPDSVKKLQRFADSLAAAGISKTRLYEKVDSAWRKADLSPFKSKNPDSVYIVKRKELTVQNGERTVRIDYTDTGSTRLVKTLAISKDNYTFNISTLTHTADTLATGFTERFFNSFRIAPGLKGESIYSSKVDTFFKDYYSSDTSRRKIARSAIGQVRFEKKDIYRITEAIDRLSIKDKDYFDTKTQWIDALSDIDDSTAKPAITATLKTLYEKAGDTSKFQNAVLKSLSGLHTKESYALFKQYLLQDPPVEVSGNSYSDDSFMENEDSLELVKTLFPEILQLTSLDDYKSTVNNMLIRLIDSNKIAAKEYEPYFSKILFDARVALKKQQKDDEKQVQEELSKEEGVEETYRYNNYRSEGSSELVDYATLLLPFYEQNAAVPKYFDKLWQTRNDKVKYDLMIKLLEKNRSIPDTMIKHFADKEEMRGELYYRLAKLKKLQLFPARYKTQAEMAKAFLYSNITDGEDDDEETAFDYPAAGSGRRVDFSRYYQSYFRNRYTGGGSGSDKKLDSIVFLKKEWVVTEKKKGYVYLYKYRRDKEDKWRIALSGLQPEKADSIAYSNSFTSLTDDKLKEAGECEDTPEEQIALALKKAVYARNRATRNFFSDGEDRSRRRMVSDEIE
jgi:uncharacterized protein YbaP (TraB family)